MAPRPAVFTKCVEVTITGTRPPGALSSLIATRKPVPNALFEAKGYVDKIIVSAGFNPFFWRLAHPLKPIRTTSNSIAKALRRAAVRHPDFRLLRNFLFIRRLYSL
jgi:hypothetical protein